MISDWETIGPLLHGTARAWRLKLDDRLKPMGLSQAKWRTLLHLSLAPNALTQTEIAARLGVEKPTVVTLLHRLEREGWVARRSSPHDRRCNTVHLGRRAQRIIVRIKSAANKLRHELLSEIPPAELRTCINVLTQICEKAERHDKLRKDGVLSTASYRNGQNKNGHSIPRRRGTRRAMRVAK